MISFRLALRCSSHGSFWGRIHPRLWCQRSSGALHRQTSSISSETPDYDSYWRVEQHHQEKLAKQAARKENAGTDTKDAVVATPVVTAESSGGERAATPAPPAPPATPDVPPVEEAQRSKPGATSKPGSTEEEHPKDESSKGSGGKFDKYYHQSLGSYIYCILSTFPYVKL